MKKIMEAEALRIMDETDLAVYRDERHYIEEWATENNKEFHTDIYLDDDGSLIVYFMDGKTIIQPRTVLTSHKKPVGRPSLGITKKVSLTLPEELWKRVEAYQTDLGGSRSETFRTILEEYFTENKN